MNNFELWRKNITVDNLVELLSPKQPFGRCHYCPAPSTICDSPDENKKCEKIIKKWGARTAP